MGGNRMNIKERALVYLYNFQSAPLLRHRKLLNDYEIVGVVSLSGWRLNDKDAGYADNGPDIGINISSNFEESLDSCDTIIFCEPGVAIDFENSVMPQIDAAIQAKKNIVCAIPLEEKFKDDIERRCFENDISFKHYKQSFDLGIQSIKPECLFTINAPVIFVLGICERTNKFEVQLSLRENFIRMGYKVSQIGTRNYCSLIGFHSFPEFMFSSLLTESNKVTLFNHYIKKIEVEEKADVIIVGIPGAIMPFNDILTNKFGILAYEVCQAVTPDAAILCTPDEEYETESFEKLSKLIGYKFGFNIDCFNIANMKVDYANSRQAKEIIFITLDSKCIDMKIKKYKASNLPVFNILNAGEAENMSRYLIDKLSVDAAELV
jgi:peptide maturation system protein (TIGR04066 family)